MSDQDPERSDTRQWFGRSVERDRAGIEGTENATADTANEGAFGSAWRWR